MPRKSKKAARTEVQATWKSRIERAKKVKEFWKTKFQVDKGLDYFEGNQNDTNMSDAEWITINEIYSSVLVELPSIYPADPYFYMRLRRAFTPNPTMILLWEQRGEIRAAMLNYYKDKLKLKDTVRMAVQDAQFAYGVVKIRANIDMEENEGAGEPILNDENLPLLGDDDEILRQPKEIPLSAKYSITRVHHDDFIWDAEAGTPEETWWWLGERVRVTQDALRKDKRFSKSAVDQLLAKVSKPNDKNDPLQQSREQRKKGDVAGGHETSGESFDQDGSSSPSKKNLRKGDQIVAYWEITDLRKKEMLAIAEGGVIPLMDATPLPDGVFDYSYEILAFTPRDDSPYPIPAISQGIDLQRAQNETYSMIRTHLKRFNRKYASWKGAMEPEEKSKLESGADGTIIMVGGPEDVPVPIKDAPLDQTNLIQISMFANAMIKVLGGQSSESQGIAGADSASQAIIINRRQSVRENAKTVKVNEFVRNIARKLDMLIQVHLDTPEAIMVNGPQGRFWALVRPQDFEEIEGEYAIETNVGSTVPQLPEMERNSWLSFLGVIAGQPQLMLSRRLLEKTAEMHHIDDEVLIDELYAVGQMVMKQQAQGGAQGQGGGVGSVANVSENNPEAVTGGQRGGFDSLLLEGAGNLEGV
ncbi:MAG: hypothetical protein JRD68_00020 [Deltaproteobacteria bacterium]|nr:hypothetical protein [Deltaproteobacteria bacterium]